MKIIATPAKNIFNAQVKNDKGDLHGSILRLCVFRFSQPVFFFNFIAFKEDSNNQIIKHLNIFLNIFERNLNVKTIRVKHLWFGVLRVFFPSNRYNLHILLTTTRHCLQKYTI